ncbi:MAG: S8 family serine peptidase [Candidatus Lernaella stagnicola]|nr:S8 family serine peptidase [Candidatus Lernaella stagnicola]
MKKSIVFLAGVLISLSFLGTAWGFDLVSMQPRYDRYEVFTDEPLVLVFDQSLDPASVGADAVVIDDLKEGGTIAGTTSLESTTVADDTLVFTPTTGFFPFARRLQVSLSTDLEDLGGAGFSGELPHLGVFVANLPNDFERPEQVSFPPSFPIELYVNANVLLGFNPLDPESPTSAEMNYVPGMSATEAWKIWTGTPDVLIAVIDVGIDRYSNAELAHRLFLNRGELPQPEDDGTPCPDWDCNGDGRFAADDYANHAGVYDINASGLLDPDDLIQLLSDEIDNDGNGHVDDISGWDFFRNVNQAIGVGQFPEGTHARLRSEDAVAQADNGVGNKPGFCPDCSVLSVRVGEAIVTEFNLMTAGMQYAVDMGADVIIVAMGVANYNYESEMAFVDAFERGVFVVAASGDELGFHHIYPAAGEDVYSVKGLMPLPPVEYGPLDLSKLAFVESYCTNYGARIDATGVTGACSSEATSNIAGIAGLLISYARHLGMDLTPGEIRQLLNMTAEDIKDSCVAINLRGCKEGWEENFAYGRVNAKLAIDRLGDPLFNVPERIPPDVRITAPRWWTTIWADEQSTFDVDGEIYARGRPYNWELQIGFGVEPNADEFISVATGSGQAAFAGKLATIDLFDYVDEAWLRRRPEAPNDFTVTLKLRATWTPEGDEPVLGEIRKALAWHIDDDPNTGLLPGFPKFIGASGVSSPVLYDMDGDVDGALEVIFGDSTPAVEMWKHNPETGGLEQASGFPVDLPPNPERLYEDAVIASVAIGQVYGDGIPYIAIATNHGFVYLIHADGNDHPGGPFVEGFPVSAMEPDNSSGLSFAHGNAFLASPTLVDLDGDGVLEIVAASYDQHLYAWKTVDGDLDGEADIVPGFPVPLDSSAEAGLVPPAMICDTNMPAQVLGSPMAAILDPDHSNPDIANHPAIVVPTSEACRGSGGFTGRVYAVYWNGLENEDGPFLPGWPAVVLMPLGDELPIPPLTIGMTSSPAGVIHNGELIISVGSFFWLPQLITWDGAHTRIKHLGSRLNVGVTANGSFGHFGNDDSMWYFFPTAGFIQGTENGFRAAAFNIVGWNLDDLPKAAWRKNFEDINFFVNPIIGDIDYDGSNEVIAGSGGYIMHASNIDLEEPDGWPKFTQNWMTSSPAVDDIDGDRYLEIAAVTQEGNFFAWGARGKSCVGDRSVMDWPRFRHDPHSSGFYDTDATPPRLVRDLHVYRTDEPGVYEIVFTAPGDDHDCGTAAYYDIRYATDAGVDLRDPDIFGLAATLDPPTPVSGGQEVRLTVQVDDLQSVAIRSYDEVGWVSPISNAAAPEDPQPTDDDDDDDNDDTSADDDSGDDDDDDDAADDDDDDDDNDDDDEGGCGC